MVGLSHLSRRPRWVGLTLHSRVIMLIKEAQVGVVNHGRVITRLLKKFAKFGSLYFRGDINLIFQSFSHKKRTHAKI